MQWQCHGPDTRGSSADGLRSESAGRRWRISVPEPPAPAGKLACHSESLKDTQHLDFPQGDVCRYGKAYLQDAASTRDEGCGDCFPVRYSLQPYYIYMFRH